MLILIACATGAATMLGGIFALAYRDRFHAILGFSAGAVIGVAFFDLIPESVALIGGADQAFRALSWVAIGFVLYMAIDRFLVMHTHHHDDYQGESHDEVHAVQGQTQSKRGLFGAGSLSVHSFLDGIAIGLAFQVSAGIGAIVAVAVLAHDFSDGINTVAIIMKNGGSKNRAFKFLALDAVAPILGIVVTRFFTLPEGILGIILAIFAGFFLYIGASDLLPESHHSHPTIWTTLMTVFGISLIYFVIRVVG